MRARVRRELRAQSEGAAAAADVRALAGVHGQVRGQLGAPLEPRAARDAGVLRRRVRARVRAQRRRRLAGRAARRAHEGAAGRVRARVLLQVAVAREGLAARGAGVRAQARVQRPHVARQVGAVPEGEPARVAAVAPLPAVRAHVPRPRAQRHALLAHSALGVSFPVLGDSKFWFLSYLVDFTFTIFLNCLFRCDISGNAKHEIKCIDTEIVHSAH